MFNLVFKKVRVIITLIKVWLQRTQGWLSVFTGGMVLFLVLGRLKDAGVITIDLDKSFILIYPAILLIMLVVGYFEDKLGYFKEEAYKANLRNPHFVEILDIVKRLESRFDKVEQRLSQLELQKKEEEFNGKHRVAPKE